MGDVLNNHLINNSITEMHKLLLEEEYKPNTLELLYVTYSKIKSNEKAIKKAFEIYPSDMKMFEYILDNLYLLLELKNKYENIYVNQKEFCMGLYINNKLNFNEQELNYLNSVYNKIIHILIDDLNIQLEIGNCPSIKNKSIISLKKEKIKTYSLQN